MIKVRQIKIDVNKDSKSYLRKKVIEKLKIKDEELISFKINKRSIDARDKEKIFYVYEVILKLVNEEKVLKKNKKLDISKVEDIPYKIEVTTINHNNINEDLDIHYVAKEKFDIGITEIKSPYSNPIKIYNAERCICDILKNPDSVDLEVYNKIINNYFKQKNKDLSALEEYSKIFNIYDKLHHIIEILI